MANSFPKIAILAGGRGSRLLEETRNNPKPLVRIGDAPILVHVMRQYAMHGFKEFVIALGYLGQKIIDYMSQPNSQGELPTTNRLENHVELLGAIEPGWSVTLVDTKENTATGGRIKRLAPYLAHEPFMLTWADGLADIDHHAALDFHQRHGRLATVTAVQPPNKFGKLQLKGDSVVTFKEKPQDDGAWINGAFFVLQPEIFCYIKDDQTVWEQEPMEKLAADNQLMAYRHTGYWQCMDNIAEKQQLDEQYRTGKAPWLRQHV